MKNPQKLQQIAELLEKQKAGEVYLPREDCTLFHPVYGCLCNKASKLEWTTDPSLQE